MYRQLCVCDVEPVYLKRLAAYLSRKPELLWRIKTYTELEVCLRERPEILIVSGGALEQWMQKKNTTTYPEVSGCQMIFLEDEPRKECPWPMVRKYQAAGRLYEELLGILAEDMMLKTEVIGVYGPSDGPEAECIARDLGRKYLEKGDVLIVSLTEYSTFYGGLTRGHGIEDWFYYYIQQAKEKIRLSEWVFTEDRLNYLYGFRTIYDQRSIRLEDWQNFFKEGIRKSPYRTVIFVFDRMPDHLELFMWCDLIYVQWGRDGYADLRKEKFEKMTAYMEIDELIKKLIET